MILHVARHADAAAFLWRALPWLLHAEAEHNLVLGLAHRLTKSTAGFEPPIYLATIESAGEVVGCAFRTPPFKLGVTRMPEDALPLLVEDVATVYDAIPGALGPQAETTLLAGLWSARTGLAARQAMRNRIYQAVEVLPPRRTPRGHVRVARPGDRDLVAGWVGDFTAEAHVLSGSADRIDQLIGEGSLLLWEDEGPRSMAAEVARTPNGARVGYVYTPPAWRGRGYASACVAALSQLILDSGAQFCFLYTDLANPTSNAIYSRLGYRPVADVVDYEFVE